MTRSAPSRIELLVGIDGGATKTLLRLARPDLSVLADVVGGPANIARDAAAAWRAIEAALDEALERAGLGSDDVAIHAGVGLAGALVPGVAERIRPAAERRFASWRLHSDAYIACLGAHLGQDGAVLSVGTGSVGFSIVGGVERRVGGWGFPQGDEGGGAFLGLEAVRLVLLVRNGRAAAPSLLALAIEAFGAAQTGGLAGWASHASAASFATLAPEVIDAARRGDPLGLALARRSADEIDALAVSLLDGTVDVPCCLLGSVGLAIQPFLSEALRRRLVAPSGDSADGGLLMALGAHRAAG